MSEWNEAIQKMQGLAGDADVVPVSVIAEPSRHQNRVIVYSSDEAVPSQRFIAYVTVPTKTVKTGVMSERRLGISFAGATDEAARSAAELWWNEQLDRERAREAEAIERGRRLEAARAAKSPTLPHEDRT